MPNIIYNGIPFGGSAVGVVLRATPIFDGGLVTSASAVVGGVINFSAALNTLTLAADQVFTYAGATTANTWIRLRLINSGGADRTMTIPNTLSLGRGVNITTFTLKGNSTQEIVLCYNGTGYEIFNEYATAGQIGYPVLWGVACSDETTALTIGNAKVSFRAPCAMELAMVRGSLSTAQASGSIFTSDLNVTGVGSILSTKLTIDNAEKTSTTAAIPPVLSTTSIADDAEFTVDFDQVGDGTAKGFKILLIGIMR